MKNKPKIKNSCGKRGCRITLLPIYIKKEYTKKAA